MISQDQRISLLSFAFGTVAVIIVSESEPERRPAEDGGRIRQYKYKMWILLCEKVTIPFGQFYVLFCSKSNVESLGLG